MINIFLFFIFYFLLLFDSFSQCAMCRTTIENNVSIGDNSLAFGLNFGILYLLMAPYVLITFFIFLFYRKKKNY